MYRLILCGLLILASISIAFGFFGILPFSGFQMLLSHSILFSLCYCANYVLSKIFKAEVNPESSFITALILFFVLSPIVSGALLPMFILTPVLAMASKYILTLHKTHIFNPAAISIFIAGLFGSGIVAWWVATPSLLPFVIVCGFLIVRKLQKFGMFFIFLLSSFGTALIFATLHHTPISVFEFLTSWPTVFFGTIMLTEPFTTPPKYKEQIAYGAVIGFLFGLPFHFGSLYFTPEFALIVGNIFSYMVSNKRRITLTLKEKNKLSADVYEFVFNPDHKFSFDAGQYMEWTLSHKKPDSRGSRRYFTISSSPTEQTIRLTTKFAEKSSTFKKELLALTPGSTLLSAQIEGDFTLPKDPKQKLVWIAGGIGITPYRSMAKFLADTYQKRDIVLLYSARTLQDLVYKDFFNSLSNTIGLKYIFIFNDAKITPLLIQKEILDYKERYFYISGPEGMVEAFEGMLKNIGVASSQIRTDFFPGYI